MPKPIRLLLTIPNFDTAGSGLVVLNILRRLDRTRFEPTVCVERRGGLDSAVEALGVPLLVRPFTLAARPRTTLLARAHRAAAAFRDLEIDVWHSWHYLDDYTEPLIARLAGARWLYTKKSMSWGGNGWRLRSLLAQRIVADNNAMLEEFFGGRWLRGRTRLVPHGVDAERFRPVGSPTDEFRGRHGIPADVPLIGCVAHLLPVKGQDLLIEALGAIPEAHLVLAGRRGDEEYATRLETLVEAHGLQGRVHFLGTTADIPALLHELELFVLPSRRGEGCPVALLEAMASCRACIATDVAGARDLLAAESGVSPGLLVPPDDRTSLARAIGSLLETPGRRAELGELARARVLERYTADREAAAYQDLYQELAAR